jgi:hypothetical protein
MHGMSAPHIVEPRPSLAQPHAAYEVGPPYRLRKTPGGIIPLWGARSSRNRGAASSRYRGAASSRNWGQLPPESADSGKLSLAGVSPSASIAASSWRSSSGRIARVAAYPNLGVEAAGARCNRRSPLDHDARRRVRMGADCRPPKSSR